MIRARYPWRVRAWALLPLCLLGCNGQGPESDLAGAACGREADCDGLVCGASSDGPWADLEVVSLTCGAAAGSRAPGQACEASNDCENGLCLLAGTCARPCARADDCEQGWRCRPGFVRVPTGDGLQRMSTCARLLTLPDESDSSRVDLPDAATAGTDELPLAGTDRPAVYILEHLDDDSWPASAHCRPPLCPVRLATTGDDPVTLFDVDASGPAPPITPVATLDSTFPATVYVGNGPDARFSPEGYTLTVTSEQPGSVAVTRVRQQPGSSGQRLDLNVFYVGALDWEPTGARGPELLEEALEVVDAIFAPADIYVGEVRQFDVPGELRQRGLVFDSGQDPGAGLQVLARRFGVWAELPGLFRLSLGAPGPAVNLFFVQDIAGMGSGEVRALAGGTPGPMGMHGTGASGIAIATDMMLGEPQQLGRTLAHELGHYLGLFHTSERNGEVLDPFDDTPSCTLEDDRDGDDLLSATECVGKGDDNLMFWANTNSSHLSPQQIKVLQQAAILR